MILKWKGPENFNVMLPVGGRNFVYPKFAGMKAEHFAMPPPNPIGGLAASRPLREYTTILGDVPAGKLFKVTNYRSSDLLPVKATFGNPPTFSDTMRTMGHVVVV